MSTFLASLISLDNGSSPPVALPGEQVIDYFISKNDQDDKRLIVNEIAAFMGRAEVGDWRSFDDLGFIGDKTLTLVKVRSDKPGIKPGRR